MCRLVCVPYRRCSGKLMTAIQCDHFEEIFMQQWKWNEHFVTHSSNDDDRFIWLQSIFGREVCCWRFVRSPLLVFELSQHACSVFRKKGHIKTISTYTNGRRSKQTFMLYDHFWDVLLIRKKKCSKKSNIKNVDEITELEQ